MRFNAICVCWLLRSTLKHIYYRLALECFVPVGDVLDPVWLSFSDSDMALAQRATALHELTLARQTMNIWECGRWTAASLAALRSANPAVRVRLVHC